MKVTIIHDVKVSPHSSQEEKLTFAYPLTTLAKDGSIVCAYRRGKEKHSYDGTWLCQRSTDQGKTWSAPVTIFDGRGMSPPQSVVSGGICTTHDGSLLSVFYTVAVTKPHAYFHSEEGGTQNKWAYVARSTDAGQTWNWKLITHKPVLRLGFGFTSSPLVLSDGHVFIPGERRQAAGNIGIFATHSDDHGETLELFADCIVDPDAKFHLCDGRYDQFPDGQVLGLLWTIRVEDDKTFKTRRAVSSDQGRTWSTAEPVGFLGQIVQPLILDENRVLAVSNHRWEPQGIYLWLSSDRGITWRSEQAVCMWDPKRNRMVGESVDLPEDHGGASNMNIWNALAAFNFGTPDLTALPDGTVFLTYYATTEGVTHVRACRFEIYEKLRLNAPTFSRR